MKHAVTCKICRKPLLIEVDDEYQGDPLKLLPLATCNRCYDLRDRRERLHHAIGKICYQLTISKTAKGVPESVSAEAKSGLISLTKSYAQWYCDFYKLTPWENCWDAMLAEKMMERPRNWETVLREYRKAFRPVAN